MSEPEGQTASYDDVDDMVCLGALLARVDGLITGKFKDRKLQQEFNDAKVHERIAPKYSIGLLACNELSCPASVWFTTRPDAARRTLGSTSFIRRMAAEF